MACARPGNLQLPSASSIIPGTRQLDPSLGGLSRLQSTAGSLEQASWQRGGSGQCPAQLRGAGLQTCAYKSSLKHKVACQACSMHGKCVAGHADARVRHAVFYMGSSVA